MTNIDWNRTSRISISDLVELLLSNCRKNRISKSHPMFLILFLWGSGKGDQCSAID